MNKSDQIDLIAKALVAVQKELKPVFKGADNPFFKSAYADHESVVKASADLLAKNGLAVSQGMANVSGLWAIETVLMHESGQWLSFMFPCEPVKKDPQGYASANTYGRRIGHMGILGMAATDDDDGNGASAPNGPPPVDQEKAVREITDLLKTLKKPESNFIEHLHVTCKRKDIETFYDLSRDEAEGALVMLRSLVAKQKTNGANGANPKTN